MSGIVRNRLSLWRRWSTAYFANTRRAGPPSAGQHSGSPDAEDLARQLDLAEKQLTGTRLSLSATARLREQVADLADRAAWLTDFDSRNHLTERARKCLERLG